MHNQKLGGRYQIIKPLMPPGGFGVTFIACDTQRVGNPQCVVKKLQPRSNDPHSLRIAQRLFAQEAEMLGKLGEHHQIPQLLANFEEDQDFYIVQEYIDGHDLSQEIPPTGNKLPEALVIQLLKEILEVLKFVHQNNVIHRDIKPSNIRRRKSDDKIVLIDFGAVKQISSMEVNAEGETRFTVPIGTYGYMPSEQAVGNPKLSSDIYAVGIIGIQALTGIYPDPHGRMPTDSEGEILWRDKAEVSPKFAEILAKMVRYDHRQRYSNATEVLDAIKQLLKDKENRVKKSQLIRNIVLGLIGLAVTAIILYKILPNQRTVQLIYSYDNAEKGIKINYPQDWRRQDLQNGITGEWVSFLSTPQSPKDNFEDKLTISIKPFKGTLDDYKTLIEGNIQSTNNKSVSQVTLANRRAYQLIYNIEDRDNNLKNLKVFTLQSGNAYVITYTAKNGDYDKFLPAAEAMINSFEIK
ncbi:serine/threonine protein kinase [Calothrix sp. NIES-4071]|nr:serine/threonine protein kinase [Calothrix sp. NIES-4071]BAZ56558.1 serine/threonine protein kinase [Calothrix sp. NIES-4105]